MAAGRGQGTRHPRRFGIPRHRRVRAARQAARGDLLRACRGAGGAGGIHRGRQARRADAAAGALAEPQRLLRTQQGRIRNCLTSAWPWAYRFSSYCSPGRRRCRRYRIPVFREAAMRLTVLGYYGGIGGVRRTTALLVAGDILIDAGSRAGDLTLERMALLEHIFLTHAHLDHSGFVPLLADAAAYLRQRPLNVHALPETIAALKKNMLNGELWPDYSVLPSADDPYIRFVPLARGATLRLRERRITPLPACHSVPAVGYRLDSGTASFVYSGTHPLWSRCA